MNSQPNTKNFSAITKQRLNTPTMRGLFLLALIVAISLLVPNGWLWLLITLPLAVWAFYSMASEEDKARLNAWFINRLLTAATLLSAWVILACLILWLLVTVWLSPMFTRQTPALLLDEAGMYVTIDLPGAVSADGQPTKLPITLYNGSTITQTITLTAELDATSHFQFVTPPRLADVIVAPQSSLTKTVIIANTNPTTWYLVTNQSLSMTALLGTGENVREQWTLIAEGSLGLWLRQFINSTVQQASPLVLVIAFLVPGFIQLIQYYIKEEKRKEAREKEARQQQIKEQLDAFRYAILSEDLDRAKAILDQLENGTQANKSNLSVSQKKDLQIARKLLDLANMELSTGNSDTDNRNSIEEYLRSLIRGTEVWHDECIAAYLQTHKRFQDQMRSNIGQLNVDQQDVERYRNGLQIARAYLPTEKVERKYLLDILSEIESVPENTKVERTWPPLLYLPLNNQSSQTSKRIVKQELGNNWAEADVETLAIWLQPFVYWQAEDDAYTLFANLPVISDLRSLPAFWPKHPAYQKLSEARSSFLAFGPTGSGKTAFALSLLYNPQDRSETLSVYLKNQTPLVDVRIHFAQQLLNFIQLNPTYLERLASAEQDLLAAFLSKNLGAEFVKAAIKRIQIDIDRSDWLKEQVETGAIDPLREATRRQLSLFYQFLSHGASAKREADLSNSNINKSWGLEISVCAKAFGFKKIQLILDLSEGDTDWLQSTILPNVAIWQKHNLYTFVFLPHTSKEVLARNSHDLPHVYLHWTADQLSEMLQHRYERVHNSRRKIWEFFDEVESCFESEAEYEYNLLQVIWASQQSSRYTPRAFMKHWEKIILSLSLTEVGFTLDKNLLDKKG